MYSDNRLQYIPILAFFSFCSRSMLGCLQAEDATGSMRPQAIASYQKSIQGIEQKELKKSDKKSVLIPYFNNIEITSIKIFAETPEILGKSGIFFLNGLFSLINSTLICDRILVGFKEERRLGSSFLSDWVTITGRSL